MKYQIIKRTIILMFITMLSCSTYADKEFEAIYQQALQASRKAGEIVKLSDQATLNVPAGHVFIPQKEAVKISQAIGTSASGFTRHNAAKR